MAMYLNKDNRLFNESINSKIYVDKTMLIKYTNENISTNDKFMCVTRPRRFGKTMALSMLNAYYSKGCDSRELFKDLKIYNDPSFEIHLNKHNVFYIDMSSIYSKCEDKTIVLKQLKKYIIEDLNEVFPNVLTDQNTIADAIVKINSKLKERFIFLIDEWDCIYRESKDEQLKNEYTDLLRALFKGNECSSCIDLVYMTGILPIRKYNDDSTLNNFNEYNMIMPRDLGEFMGFTESEVKSLCAKYNISFDEIKKWYNGYKLKKVGDIYNPRSVVTAILIQECADYWVSTRGIEDIITYVNYKDGELKTQLALLLEGENVPVNVSKFSNDLTKIKSADSALTVLIHLGYLAYNSNEKACYIPNYEIIQEMKNIMDELDWREISNPITDSPDVVEALFKNDINFVAEAIQKVHMSLTTQHNKNNEEVVGNIVEMALYSIQRKYYMHKELQAATGTADIVYVPIKPEYGPAVIIELKVDKSTKTAIRQIIKKKYINCLSNYTGDVKLIGINYSNETLDYTIEINETVKI